MCLKICVFLNLIGKSAKLYFRERKNKMMRWVQSNITFPWCSRYRININFTVLFAYNFYET